jgi:hypothetical protein
MLLCSCFIYATTGNSSSVILSSELALGCVLYATESVLTGGQAGGCAELLRNDVFSGPGMRVQWEKGQTIKGHVAREAGKATISLQVRGFLRHTIQYSSAATVVV